VRFVDECRLRVEAGKGGDGCIAFRRERFAPFGGPSGGDGGNGGSVVFVADEGLGTLLDLQHVRLIRAKDGERGMGSDCYGRAAKDERVRVPVGTQVFDEDTGELFGELITHGQELVVARGGNGGWGNIHFATPTDRAPRRANPGQPGESRELHLELKVLADVGLLGFPNVGKSTFISSVSRARPKVADYPFTTLVPHLGVVKLDDWIGADVGEGLVIADIPGLIPGASEGAGLGVRFLKHLERTRVLLHLITLDPAEDREPLADYDVVRGELEKFDPELAQRPEVIALSKSDITEVRELYEELREKFAARGKTLYLVSAATRDGVRDVIGELARVLRASKNA
jgi:GTP-binding protein